MISFPRFLWRHTLLVGCTTALLSAQPPRSRSTPAHKEPTTATAPTASKFPPLSPELKLVAQFDRDGDQRLDATERAAARAYLTQNPEPVPTLAAKASQRPTEEDALILEPVSPGEKITPAQVPSLADQPLYARTAVRTLFLEFPDADWEAELSDFARTDVLVPARLTVDGRSFTGVGVHFSATPAGAALSAGYKRPLSVALDFTQVDQRLLGERQLELDDARSDPTFTRDLLYRQIANAYLPTPAAKLVRVVINGEFWGIYVSRQPLDETFTRANFGSAAGTRWLARDGAHLAYLGDDPAPYREHYQLLGPDDPAAWAKLIQLCKTLDQTPLSQLESALTPQFDVDHAIKFMALETALINHGAYLGAGRGYGLYLDPAGRFHLIPFAGAASFRLLTEREFVSGPSGGAPRNDPPREKSTAKKDQPETPPVVSPNGSPSDFPRQSSTDLAMLLSYSFINKVDRNNDLKLSKEEWLDFARAWFIVIDEDFVGEITPEQLTKSVRNLVSPASMRNPRAKQTFAGDDAASLIAQDLWKAMNQDHNERVSREEFAATFASWFTAWTDAKSPQLTQPILDHRFETLFSRTVFQADQLYVAKRAMPTADNEDGRGGEGGGFNANASFSLLGSIGGGPGGGGRGGGRGSRGGSNTRSVVTYYEQLDPLGPLEDPVNALYIKLLAAPSLRFRYLSTVRDIADTWLNWQRLGPIAKAAQAAVADDVKRETHTATGYIRFVQELDQDMGASSGRTRDSTVEPNLKAFIEERRVFIQKNTMSND